MGGRGGSDDRQRAANGGPVTNVDLAMVAFIDVVDSVGLYARMGDVDAHATIDGALADIERHVLRYGGRVVKRNGDALLICFVDVAEGVHCLAESIASPALPLRVGAQHGPVLERDADVFGDTVNKAARLAGLARGGEILLGEDLVNTLLGGLRGRCRRIDKRRLKGDADRQVLYRFDWQGEDEEVTRVNPALSVTTMGHRSALLLDTGDAAVLLKREERCRIGRDPSCDLVLDDPHVSRFHATLEWHRGRFVLHDHSTNGSYVHAADLDETIFIRREQLPLTGTGSIGFAPDGTGASVRFHYE